MTQKVGMARYYAVIALVIALDQITKFAVEAKYAVHQFEPVTSFFNLGLTYNPGAAFSFLADHDGWQRWFFTVVAIRRDISGVCVLMLFAFSKNNDEQLKRVLRDRK